jgi:hypothetical protein
MCNKLGCSVLHAAVLGALVLSRHKLKVCQVTQDRVFILHFWMMMMMI